MKKLSVEFPLKESNENPCIVLSGSFHNVEAMNFKNDLLNFLKQCESNCIIDITAVKYMDLTALNALIIAQKEILNKGRKLIIKTDTENPIFELLDLTKFDRHLNLKIAA